MDVRGEGWPPQTLLFSVLFMRQIEKSSTDQNYVQLYVLHLYHPDLLSHLEVPASAWLWWATQYCWLIKKGWFSHSLGWMPSVQCRQQSNLRYADFINCLPKCLSPGGQQDMQLFIGLSLEQDDQNSCTLHYPEANKGRLRRTWYLWNSLLTRAQSVNRNSWGFPSIPWTRS